MISKAYEILKDPISRQLYDLGKITSLNPHSRGREGNVTYEEFYSSKSGASYPSYYYNQWSEVETREENKSYKSKLEGVMLKMSLVLGAVLLYDIWRERRRKKKKQSVIDSETQKVAVGPLVFESPLVFVRDRPVDPAKLQEEMKRKQFRIKYENPKPRVSSQINRTRSKSKSETKVVELDQFMDNRKDKVIRE